MNRLIVDFLNFLSPLFCRQGFLAVAQVLGGLALLPAQSFSTDELVALRSPIDTSLDITNSTWVYKDRNWNMGIAEAQSKFREGCFFPLDSLPAEGKFTRGRYSYWLHFALLNASPDTMEAVFKCSHFDSIFLYEITAEGARPPRIFGKMTGGGHTFKELKFPDPSATLLRLPPGDTLMYFLRQENIPTFYHSIRPVLYNPAFFPETQKWQNVGWLLFLLGGFFGIVLFSILFFLVQYLQNRDQAFLYYALYFVTIWVFYWRAMDMNNPHINLFPLRRVRLHFDVA